jgi:hypothetical protein
MPDPHFANTPAYFKEVSTGVTPSSGQVSLYAKTDGLLYSKDDVGIETALGGGGGGSSGAYLPLSGGTLTGTLSVSSGGALRSILSNSTLSFANTAYPTQTNTFNINGFSYNGGNNPVFTNKTLSLNPGAISINNTAAGYSTTIASDYVSVGTGIQYSTLDASGLSFFNNDNVNGIILSQNPGQGQNNLQLYLPTVDGTLITDTFAWGNGQTIGWADAVFARDNEANAIAQRRTTNPQTFRIYNTFITASRYERGFSRWNSNVFQIGTEKLGTGMSARPLGFVTDGVERLNIDTAGSITAIGPTLTGSQATNTLNLSANWNTTGNPTLIYGRVANTASGATANLIDVGTTASGSLFSVSKAGFVTAPHATLPTATIGGLLMSGSFSGLVFNNGWWTNGSDIRFGSTGRLTFASGSAPGNAADVILSRDAPNTLALRNDTNPQTFNTYNTSTSANLTYERGFSRWNSNVFQIGTEKLGTGVARAMSFVTDGVARWNISATGELLAATDDANNIGGLGANRPNTVNVAFRVRVGNSEIYDNGSSGLAIRGGSGSGGIEIQGNAFNPGATLRFLSRGLITPEADGVFSLKNNAGTDFGRLQFGGTTSSFPALKRSSATLQARLADDSGFAGFSCGALTTNGPTTETQFDIGNSGATVTISLANGTFQSVTLTNNCTFTMPTALAGQSFTLQVRTGAGSFTAAFTNVRWSSGISPVITTAASRMDIASFLSDGTNWYGNINANYTV